MDVHNKHNFFVSVRTDAPWMKPDWPAEPIFLTTTFLIGALKATPEEPASLILRMISIGRNHVFCKWRVLNAFFFQNKNDLFFWRSSFIERLF